MIPTQARTIKPTRRSVSGIYPFRGETAIPYESTLERDFIARNEFNRTVLDIIPQPCQIRFSLRGGREYTYTPDFLVYFRLGNRTHSDFPRPLLVEVKPESQWREHWRDWLPKWKAAYRYAKQEEWEFHIHDESRIRDQMFANIQFLERYKRMVFPREESDWIIQGLARMGSAPFHYLLARYFMGLYRAEGISHLWHLLATRQLDCDIYRPLNEHTVLWVANDE
ncbi:heteromeric transposase endonuclease subunit TnsA [Ectothiorhodospira shaposhnikovii]|uniref:heteromeric transposase endonuclease subunit TnsA n=1 Tax=Ectothiorhodospira shaposhnikovii TaxID=1054 RepID=UPI001EE8F3E1|nr:heteromeric transposase endonuclease subunit TnsA [Ectothiorhodospira shaposhnikovii]MCG5512349.1 heteromeric transposase endonuclease subunit TnsA [Ectothiorhodospira shaposhnikovii]